MRFVIVAARFNELIVRNLVDGAVDALKRHGAAEADIHVVRVPGAFELPLAAQRLARLRRYDAIVALGAVIRGQTPHFDFVCTRVRGRAQSRQPGVRACRSASGC